VTGYGLDGQGSILSRAIYFSLFHSVQIGSGAHPDSYTMGTGGSFPEVKQPRSEADHSPPTKQRSRIVDLYLQSPYVFVAWCLVN
jgi:hypothetical protein